MALKERDLSTEQYMPLRVFTVIEGNHTAERFNSVRRLLNKNRAAQFWGVEKEWAEFHGHVFNNIVPRPYNIDNRLMAIKYALREVPEPDEYISEIAYEITPKDIVLGFKKASSKRIVHTSIDKKQVKLPLTYKEAHDTPEIRHRAVGALYEKGDPVTEVVRSLEGWRKANDSIFIPDHHLRQGHETFDTILLHSETTPYAKELGRAAVNYIKNKQLENN